jgi:tRNA G10  N-methylase Trm11
MCRLAEIGPGSRLVDPCCGAGTILAEAAALGAHAVGGDLVFETLTSAAANLRTTSPQPGLVRWDARRLPLAGGWADAAICNPPWDVQVTASSGVDRFYRELLGQLLRPVRKGGRAVLLVEAADRAQGPKWALERSITVSLAGRRPTIVVLRAV